MSSRSRTIDTGTPGTLCAMPHCAPSHVVLVRGGLGGSSVAHELADSPVQLTVIKRANQYPFPPLLYQMIMAGFAFSEISATIRLRRGTPQYTTVLIGEAISSTQPC